MSKAVNPTSNFVASFATTFINIGIAVFAAILVYISYLFEVSAYSELLGPVIGSRVLEDWQLTGAEFLALGLNGAKVALIFIIAHLASQGLRGRFRLKMLRTLVLLLSLLMTLFVFAGQTVSPQAEATVSAMQQDIKDRYAAATDVVDVRYGSQRSQVVGRIAQELELLEAEYTRRLAELNEQLDKERGVGGQDFFGERYAELLRLVDEEQALFTQQSNVIRLEERASVEAIESAKGEELRDLADNYQAEYASIRLDDIYGTSEAQSPHMLRMVEMARTVIASEHVTPATVTVFLTVLVSLIIELLPIVMFGHVFSVMLGDRSDKTKDGFATDQPVHQLRPQVKEISDNQNVRYAAE